MNGMSQNLVNLFCHDMAVLIKFCHTGINSVLNFVILVSIVHDLPLN